MTNPVPGIYAIRCTSTGQCYVGSSMDIAKRWNQHRNKLKKGVHVNGRLQKAWETYGEGAFLFEILEHASIALLAEREQHWIGAMRSTKTGFNIQSSAKRDGRTERQAISYTTMSISINEDRYRKVREALRVLRIEDSTLSRSDVIGRAIDRLFAKLCPSEHIAQKQQS